MTLPIADNQATNSTIQDIINTAAGWRYTDVLPTAGTVGWGEIVVYDDGAGTKRIYVRTGKNNIGFVGLT